MFTVPFIIAVFATILGIAIPAVFKERIKNKWLSWRASIWSQRTLMSDIEFQALMVAMHGCSGATQLSLLQVILNKNYRLSTGQLETIKHNTVTENKIINAMFNLDLERAVEVQDHLLNSMNSSYEQAIKDGMDDRFEGMGGKSLEDRYNRKVLEARGTSPKETKQGDKEKA